jgi:hypothetical protein
MSAADQPDDRKVIVMAGLDPAISSHVVKLQGLPENRQMREAWV